MKTSRSLTPEPAAPRLNRQLAELRHKLSPATSANAQHNSSAANQEAAARISATTTPLNTVTFHESPTTPPLHNHNSRIRTVDHR